MLQQSKEKPKVKKQKSHKNLVKDLSNQVVDELLINLINNNLSKKRMDEYELDSSDNDQSEQDEDYLFSLQSQAACGSVPYGLPTLAMTRQTGHTRNRQQKLKKVNEKLCKIMANPNEYIEIYQGPPDQHNNNR